MERPPSLSLALGRFKHLPQRTGDVWQGGLVRLPAWIAHPTDPAAAPYRAVAALWVSLRTGLIHLKLPAVAGVLSHLESEATGGLRLPGLLESPGVDVERLRAFADAAASFYRGRVWDHLANEDLVVVEGHRLPRRMRHVSVLGQGGEQFGVSFFDSRRAFERVIDATDPRLVLRRAHGVTFGPVDELPFADVDAWTDQALPVAGPRAYPLAADLGLDGSVRRPDARELTYAEALLRALAATSEDDLDAGRWQKRVDTFDGPRDLKFTLPFLVEAEHERASVSAGCCPSRTGAECRRGCVARRVRGRHSGRLALCAHAVDVPNGG